MRTPSGKAATRIGWAVFALSAALAPAPARANIVCTAAHTITVDTPLPFVIKKSGTWCLGASRNWSGGTGSAIAIEASDVVLDLNGFKLGNTNAGPATEATGIHTADPRRNVTVRNGTIQGFYDGVSLVDYISDASGGQYVVEDLTVDQCTHAGIVVAGSSAVVRRNRVTGVGGSTLFTNLDTAGIDYGGGQSAVIADNVVTDVYGVGSGTGAALAVTGNGAIVRHNELANHDPVSPATLGVSVFGDHALLLENTAISFDVGLAASPALTGAARDNATLGCTTPYHFGAGVDLGNNQ